MQIPLHAIDDVFGSHSSVGSSKQYRPFEHGFGATMPGPPHLSWGSLTQMPGRSGILSQSGLRTSGMHVSPASHRGGLGEKPPQGLYAGGAVWQVPAQVPNVVQDGSSGMQTRPLVQGAILKPQARPAWAAAGAATAARREATTARRTILEAWGVFSRVRLLRCPNLGFG